MLEKRTMLAESGN
jgi:hypothetical protein